MTKAELTQQIEQLHDKAEKTFGPEFTILVRQIVKLEKLRSAMAQTNENIRPLALWIRLRTFKSHYAKVENH